MSAAELKELRKELKQCIDHADKKELLAVYAILGEKTKASEQYSLTPEQEAELDEILELDKKGLMKYSSWEEVKARIISKKRK